MPDIEANPEHFTLYAETGPWRLDMDETDIDRAVIEVNDSPLGVALAIGANPDGETGGVALAYLDREAVEDLIAELQEALE